MEAVRLKNNDEIEEIKQDKKLGESLLEDGCISSDQLQIALLEQSKNNNEMIGDTLLRLGFVNNNNLSKALAKKANVESINIKNIKLNNVLISKVPFNIISKYFVLPISKIDNRLNLAMSDPFDVVAIDAVKRFFDRNIEIIPHVVSKVDLQNIIESLKDSFETIDQILEELENNKEIEDEKNITNYEHPIIRLINFILSDATKIGASDIHFEPEDSFVRIRYRIDGVLRQKHAFHLTYWSAISHRIKIMSGMNIADTRSIQDGRFSQEICNHNVDFRVAVMPSVWGETIAIRLLDHHKSLIPLDQLGYSNNAINKLDIITKKPQGITFVTGPTGSGKTTTLYSLLSKLSCEEVHIATLEEPVEFQLDLIRQTSVKENHGLSFAKGVRGLLRMDPDIILIGEIRDAETAQMALRASMTGHQVYTTLHCNDALGALPRLIDFGLNPNILSGNLSGIIAQRLVRKLCTHCKFSYSANDQEKMILGKELNENIKLSKAKGCIHCDGTGRKGRTVIAEVISPSLKLNELISLNSTHKELLKCARKDGFKTMQEEGIELVLSNNISLEDLSRAVDLTNNMRKR